jgi:hypothetical protein
MKLWATEFRALDSRTGEMKTWSGDIIEAPTWDLAQQWCNEHKGYLKVIGELIAEIPCKEGTYEADFNKMIDFDIIKNN